MYEPPWAILTVQVQKSQWSKRLSQGNKISSSQSFFCVRTGLKTSSQPKEWPNHILLLYFVTVSSAAVCNSLLHANVIFAVECHNLQKFDTRSDTLVYTTSKLLTTICVLLGMEIKNPCGPVVLRDKQIIANFACPTTFGSCLTLFSV